MSCLNLNFILLSIHIFDSLFDLFDVFLWSDSKFFNYIRVTTVGTKHLCKTKIHFRWISFHIKYRYNICNWRRVQKNAPNIIITGFRVNAELSLKALKVFQRPREVVLIFFPFYMQVMFFVEGLLEVIGCARFLFLLMKVPRHSLLELCYFLLLLCCSFLCMNIVHRSMSP